MKIICQIKIKIIQNSMGTLRYILTITTIYIYHIFCYYIVLYIYIYIFIKCVLEQLCNYTKILDIYIY